MSDSIQTLFSLSIHALERIMIYEKIAAIGVVVVVDVVVVVVGVCV